MKKPVLLGGLAAGTLLVGWLAMPYHPLYQEWACREASLDRLQALRKELPANASLLYYLGRRLGEARRQEEALPLLQQAALLDGDSARIRDSLTAIQMALGQTREAYTGLREFYTAHPDLPEAYLMLGRFYLTTQTSLPAIQLLKEATVKFADNPECWALLAIAHQSVSDTRGAETATARAVALAPGVSKYWFLQAQIQKQAGNTNARASYEQAVRLAPEDLAIQAAFADYLARSGDVQAAERHARTVLSGKGEDLQASGALGLALAERGDPAAGSYLLKGLEHDPTDMLILRTLLRLSMRQGKKEEAARWRKEITRVQNRLDRESQLRTLLERNPGDKDALRQMAALAAEEGDYFRCMQYQARALGQVADSPASLLAAADDLRIGGHPELARRLAEQALQNSRTPEEQEQAMHALRLFSAPLSD